MGSQLCGDENILQRQVNSFPSMPPRSQPLYQKVNNISIRFGNIEVIKISKTKHRLVMPVNNTSQIVTVQCNILSNPTDIQSYQWNIFQLMTDREAPIIDIFDTLNDRQYYQKVTKRTIDSNKDKYSIKVYQFSSYRDQQLKNDIYEAYLYRNMSKSMLKDCFIIDRGTPMCLVMVFSGYQCSLFDLIMYRSLSNSPWSDNQKVYIIDQLIQGYRQFSLNLMAHRDIRASKVFLKSRSTYIRGTFDKYQFANLQSSRQIDTMQLRDKSNLLMSVKGVPFFTNQKVRALHEQKQKIALYDYQLNDRIALVRLICSIVLLNPYETRLQLRNQFPQINQICQLLLKKDFTIENVSHKMSEIANKYSDEDNYGIINEDYNYAEILSKDLILDAQKNNIKQTYLQTLFLLHRKDEVIRILESEMQQNQRNKVPENNIPIIHRIAKYFQGIGQKSNEYYVKEINLYIKLAQKQRQYGFHNKQNEYITKALQLQNKNISSNQKTPLLMTQLYRQAGYNSMYSKNNKFQAKEMIQQCLLNGARGNSIPIDIQLKAIEASALIQGFQNSNQEMVEDLFEKGLNLASDRGNFTDQNECQKYQCIFQYRLGKSISQKIKKQKIAINRSRDKVEARFYNAKQIGKAETYLKSAIEGFQRLQNQTLNLTLSLEALGQLHFYLRDDEPQAINCLKRAQVLMNSTDRKVHPDKMRNILKSLQELYQRSRDKQKSVQIEQKLKKVESLSENGTVRKHLKFGNDRSTMKKNRMFKGPIYQRSSKDEDDD